MYINPNSDIWLLHSIPLDNTYEHTIYFETDTAQYNYFSKYVLKKFNKQSYLRVNKGVATLDVKADDIYNCNYMMFRNTAYGSKWFYAFITGIEYVNDNCTNVTFEIDVMQTWFFVHNVEACFVEREHPVTDEIGEHYEPENVDTGEYVFNDYGNIDPSLTPMAVIVMVNDTAESPDGELYNGIYGGCTLYAFNSTDSETITTFLSHYDQAPEAVVSIYMIPTICIEQALKNGEKTRLYKSEVCKYRTVTVQPLTDSTFIDGYTPKCKKLYTYPYNFYTVNTGTDSAVYRYELFDDLLPQFRIDTPVTYPVQIQIRPMYYKGCKDTPLNSEGITLTNYPLCSWSTDAFRAWLAQNSLPITSTAITGGLSLGLGLGGMIPLSEASNNMNHVGNLLMQGYQASIKADITRGNIYSGSVAISSKSKGFYGGRCSITSEYAKMIDDYFNMYGYAVKRVKHPNFSSRPHWNYVKTAGCCLKGSVPADDARKLCNIYDNGITFWKNGDEIGDYSLDNSPT